MKTMIAYLILVALKFLLVCGLRESYENPIFDTCSIEQKYCQLHNDTLIDSISGFDAEECRQLCIDMDYCKFFTHFGSSSYPFSNHCMLFSR